MATLWDYQRQLRRVAASRDRSAVQELRQVYADVLQQLQGILGKYYTAYGSGTESTLSQADLRLAGQYQSFLYDVQKQLDGLSAPVQSRIRQTIADTYTLCYDGMAAAVRQAAQGNRTLQEALRGLSDTTPETVRHLVEHPMQELTLSDVFQRQRSRVIREIKKALTTGLAVGDSYTRMSQAIADVLGGDLAKAQRIVRTEAHRAISRGFQDVSDQTAYLLRESPYMEVKEWCSAEDGDVRSAHRKLDGVVLPVAEEFEVDGKRAACPCGFGVAELDINCRCFLKYSLVLRSEFEDRRHKAKQEQPAAKNTPQVQAGQMTLSTASGQQTPAHAVAVQPTAPPEDGGTGTVYLPEKISGKSLTSDGDGGIIKEQERPMAAKTFEKAAEYAKSKLGLSIEKISDLPVEKVNQINNTIWRIYRDVPAIRGSIDEVLLEPMKEIAVATLKWNGDTPQLRLKLSRELFSSLSMKELEDNIQACVESGALTPKDGLYGIFKHEAVHFTEYVKTLEKYHRQKEAAVKSLSEFELAKEIMHTAFVNCELDETTSVIENYLSEYAAENPAEFIAEAFSSTDDNVLVNEVKRLLSKKWGI